MSVADPDRPRVPTPVSAAIGLTAVTVERTRRLPRRVLTLPVRGVGLAVEAALGLRREYVELSERGEQVLATFRRDGGRVVADAGQAAENAAGHAVGHAVGQAVGQAAQQVDQLADRVDAAAAQVAGAPATAAEQAGEVADRAAAAAAGVPEAPQRRDTAATAEVEAAVERAVEQVLPSGAPVDHDALPLPDYDHLTLGGLRARLRRLDLAELAALRAYEKAHADRLPIVTMLDNRIAKLASDAGAAQPSGVASDRPAPGQGGTPSGSPVSPATGGPAQNPPTGGVPTNPAQPRTGGAPGTGPASSA